ncbi:hypothetical protein VOLCADRAFT_108365 [Volvox carteri f. nagariensis]|uniref:Uncharacterized protein n=1 Tax=Volvox carteri f. nagariensis TaxID=3068 RepID=D8UJQ0_VOLCA|nr:uncharacterized protein VOLCADRAFT_108365 [Volvox carteri f. nagariensis]EFJ40075.1 hypothetical protein VOLCADRAFT_108365 [Volvox carteri f. nagariensis]|eukprot:XP_002958887.1 hypothetical protein VOLCADRAFT_108365 [Volvox carteri f. nagariensis]
MNTFARGMAMRGLGIVYAALQMRVGLHRLGSGIKFGNVTADGKTEDEALTAKMRAGGNMQEYVPFGLVLMLLMETATPMPKKAVAAYGAVLALSRLSAAYGLSNTFTPGFNAGPPRKYGFLGTVGALIAAGAYLSIHALKTLGK